MVSPLRPFKCPFMSVVKQGGKHRFTDLMRVCHWDRDRSETKLIFSWFVCLKNDIFVSECSEDMCLGDNGAKELVIICDHVHFSQRMNGLKTASSLLKGRGHGETHVTLIQEMNCQWDISLSINCVSGFVRTLTVKDWNICASWCKQSLCATVCSKLLPTLLYNPFHLKRIEAFGRCLWMKCVWSLPNSHSPSDTVEMQAGMCARDSLFLVSSNLITGTILTMWPVIPIFDAN